MFNFCFNKVLTTGEGGIIATGSEETKAQLELLRFQGGAPNKEYVDYGFNLRLPSICGALGVSQEDKLDQMIARRRERAVTLNDELVDVDAPMLPKFPDQRDSVYQLHNLRFDEPGVKEPPQRHLDNRGNPTRVTYESVHLTKYYWEEFDCGVGDLPITESVSERKLTLPFHLELSDED